MTDLTLSSSLLPDHLDSAQKLAFVVDMMRELSLQTDPQEMVRKYAARMRTVVPSDANMSLSRRDLDKPYYRITRSSRWDHAPNPWKSKDRLPIFNGGVISRIIYGDAPVLIDDLESELAPDEPAREYLEGYKSLLAIPLYDQGVAMNMVVLLRKDASFDSERLPEHVWMANLFGRATHNLVLSEEVKRAYDRVDKELQVVADIQRSLLPTTLPRICGLDLAASYQTSTRAGGDYYDFFELPDGRWGILIADVSGHGTPAAVIMAVTHSIAHMLNDPPSPPSKLMRFINHNLAARYTGGSGTFVTAFYGIYDPRTRELVYSSAGHPPPRIIHCGAVRPLAGARMLPLGIDADEDYDDGQTQLEPGDALVFYTDGITEARNPLGEMFGESRLDNAIMCKGTAHDMVDCVLNDLELFRAGRTLGDDRTLLVARVLEGPCEQGADI
jgi:sigma-B regulation protein RsbU (phosphoserine phosphatase)